MATDARTGDEWLACRKCSQANYVADHKPWRIAAITGTATATS